jgi:proteic killer suppression protein
MAKRFIERVNIIKVSKNVYELTQLPGLRCHPRKGEQKGLHTIDLYDQYRLYFTLEGENLNTVCIEKVDEH